MLYALNQNGDKILATPGAKGVCPECDHTVVPKCGEIMIWHWAHMVRASCSFGEGEGAWHLKWKSLVVPAACEVKIGNHRADIVGNNGVVIELQASPIDTYDISERERAYPKMIWLFDASEYKSNIDLRNRGDYLTFRWKWPRKHQAYCEAPIYWDFGCFGKKARATTVAQYEAGDPPQIEMLRVKKIGRETPCGGYGTALTTKGFIWKYMSKWLPGEAPFTTKEELRERNEVAAEIFAALVAEGVL